MRHDYHMNFVCGIDEAGRGPLAGPVVAAAVILPKGEIREIVGDSKTLSLRKRHDLCRNIQETAISWATGWAWPDEIDTLNIHYATLLAMERAFQNLYIPLRHINTVLVDGKFCPSLEGWQGKREAIIKGDATIPEIGAASIMAKVHRDNLMKYYSIQYPQWEFEKHKGYPTKRHRELCQEFGVSPIHRKSFRIF